MSIASITIISVSVVLIVSAVILAAKIPYHNYDDKN